MCLKKARLAGLFIDLSLFFTYLFNVGLFLFTAQSVTKRTLSYEYVIDGIRSYEDLFYSRNCKIVLSSWHNGF